MWPWTHIMVGYLAFSMASHTVTRRPPTGLETLLIVGAAPMPDLIDKPLAWQFQVFAGGYALGHSIFVALPVTGLFIMWTAREGRARSGLAFGSSYLLHLVGDVATGGWAVRRILWPVVTSGRPHSSFVAGLRQNLEALATTSGTLNMTPALVGQLLIVLATVGLWQADGRPGLGTLFRGLRRLAGRGENTKVP